MANLMICMEDDSPPPTVEDTAANAENYLVLGDGTLVGLEELLQPGYSGCYQCPLRTRGNPTTESGQPNPSYLPSRCPMYEAGRHCVLEEAIVIETVQTFEREGLGDLDKFTLFSLLNSLLNLHRLSRMGQVINFSSAHLDKETADIMNKYISMTSSTNNQYVKALKEMLATKKDQTTLKMQRTNVAHSIASSITGAIQLEQAEENGDTETPNP